MKINKISLYSFDLPLTEMIDAEGYKFNRRNGLLIVISGEGSRTGFGEISPLPGRGRESIEECLGGLLRFKKDFQGAPLNLDNFNPTLPFFGLTGVDPGLSPSTIFGIESALLMLCGKLGRGLISDIIIKKKRTEGVSINGLYYPGGEESQAAYLKEKGFKTIKIKIGRIDKKKEISGIKNLWENLEKSVVIRLDGNRAMNIETINDYYEALREVNVEYIEEPLAEGIRPDIPWPVALDESIGDYLDVKRPDFGLIPDYCRALVLKPGSLWGLHNILKAILWGDKKNITITLSSAFNAGPAIAMLALASRFSGKNYGKAHGLDTCKYLKKDILKEKLEIKNGTLEIPLSIYTEEGALDFDELAEIQ